MIVFLSSLSNMASEMSPLLLVSNLLGLVVAVASALLVRKRWLTDNRPVVVAKVLAPNDSPRTLSLFIANCGNRVALNVRIVLNDDDLNRARGCSARSQPVHDIANAQIDCLVPGEERPTSFGLVSKTPQPSLITWEWVDIPLRAYAMDGRKFVEPAILRLNKLAGFAGGYWPPGPHVKSAPTRETSFQ